MKSLNIFLLIMVVALLNASPAQASVTCIGAPDISSAIKKGDGCGGVIPCEAGNYCDINAVCSPYKVVGDSCVRENDCPFGTQCVGSSATNKKCQTNANPGETCNETNGPLCGTGLNCDSNKCTAGKINDGCKNNEDCATGKCSNKVCKPFTDIGDACPCDFNQYCKDGECAAGKTSGSCTALGQECAAGYDCTPTTFKDGASMTCLKVHSVADGGWCYDSGDLCASGICHRGHCVGKSPVSCDQGGCILGESCTCEGTYLFFGSGTCKEDKCRPLYFAYEDCISLNCQNTDRDYTQSCANRLCGDAWSAYDSCDPLNILYLMD